MSSMKRIASLLVLAGILPLAHAIDQPRVLNEYRADDSAGAGVNLNTKFTADAAAAVTDNDAKNMASTDAMSALATSANTRATVFNDLNMKAYAVATPTALTDAFNAFNAARTVFNTHAVAGTLTAAHYTSLASAANAYASASTGAVAMNAANVNTAYIAWNTANADVTTKATANTAATSALNMAMTNLMRASAGLVALNATAWGVTHRANSMVAANHNMNVYRLATGLRGASGLSGYARNYNVDSHGLVNEAYATSTNAGVRSAASVYANSLGAVYTGINSADIANSAINTANAAVTTARNGFLARAQNYVQVHTDASGNFASGASNTALDTNFNAAFAVANRTGANYNDVLALSNAIDDLRLGGGTTVATNINTSGSKEAALNLTKAAMVLASEVTLGSQSGNSAINAYVVAQKALATAVNSQPSTPYAANYIQIFESVVGRINADDSTFNLVATDIATNAVFAQLRAGRTASKTAAALYAMNAATVDAVASRATLATLNAQREVVALRENTTLATLATAANTASAALMTRVAANTTAQNAFNMANAAFTTANTANTAAETNSNTGAMALATALNALSVKTGYDQASINVVLNSTTSYADSKAAAANLIANYTAATAKTAALNTLATNYNTANTAATTAAASWVTANMEKMNKQTELTAAATAVGSAQTASTAAARARDVQVAKIARVNREFGIQVAAETSSSPTIVALGEALRGIKRPVAATGATAVDKHNEGVALIDSIEALHDGIATVESNYATLKKGVDAAQASQEANNRAIDANTAAIQRNTAALQSLKNSIEFMKAGIAGAMALTGTPRLVGATQITVGSGTFEGANAFGFKIQGRINDNLAYGVGYAQGDGGVLGDASGSQIAITIGF